MHAKLKSRAELVLLTGSVILALLVRVAIDFILNGSGYRYGDDPDTFYRTGLAWRWAIQPYFIPGHWLPLQFWINGATFVILRPLIGGLDLLVPVLWNHVYFVGSLALTYLFASSLGGKEAGFAASILGATLTTDIWTTYSGLVEPMLVFFGILTCYTWWKGTVRSGGMNQRDVFLVALSAGAASAAHYSGWFIAGFAAIALLVMAVRQRLSKAIGAKTNLRSLLLGALVCGAFPITWIVANQAMYGNGFRFLAQAQSFHDWFLLEPLRLRLSSALRELVAAEPLLIALSFVAIPFVAKRSPGAISYLSAPVAYLLCLMFAGIMGYGVPTLHARYVLFLYWTVIPFAATFLVHLLSAQGILLRAGGLVVLVVLAVSGAVRAFGYSNWMDEETVAAAQFVNGLIGAASRPIQVLVEGETCLYPIAALENSVSRPDWVTSVGYEDPRFAPYFSEGALQHMDVIVVTNPLTREAVGAHLQNTDEIGYYSTWSPGSNDEELRHEADWFSGWTVLGGSRLVHAPEGSFFTFAEEPSLRGEAIGIEKMFTTEANACYILSGEVQDRFRSQDWPWVLLQQVVLNGGVLWSHDLSAGGTCGWNRFAEYILPTKEEVEIQIRTVASPVADFPFAWDYAALTGVRNLELTTCP
ncbi:MAG: hypothetical protein WD906_07430 [Anaerolineales bacterium]